MKIKKEEIAKEEVTEENNEKNTYEKFVAVIKSMLSKQVENKPEEVKEDIKIQEYQKQIKEYKNLLKENESINLLKTNGLDLSLKDIITHHPNPQDAVKTLKSFKEEQLKKVQEIQPLNIDNQNKSKLHYFE